MPAQPTMTLATAVHSFLRGTLATEGRDDDTSIGYGNDDSTTKQDRNQVEYAVLAITALLVLGLLAFQCYRQNKSQSYSTVSSSMPGSSSSPQLGHDSSDATKDAPTPSANL